MCLYENIKKCAWPCFSSFIPTWTKDYPNSHFLKLLFKKGTRFFVPFCTRNIFPLKISSSLPHVLIINITWQISFLFDQPVLQVQPTLFRNIYNFLQCGKAIHFHWREPFHNSRNEIWAYTKRASDRKGNFS